MIETKNTSLLGIPVAGLSADEALSRLSVLMSDGSARVVNHLAVDPLVLAGSNEALRAALLQADLNLPDGSGVAFGLRALYGQRVSRLPGTEMMLATLKHGVARGWTHGLVGGTEDSVRRLARDLEELVPGVRIAAAYSPPFRNVTADGVSEDVSNLGDAPDILWVGLGTPKQQIWAHLARPLAPARLIVTVGAAFDFLSGTKKRAPVFVQRAGLEWMHRLLSEPRRLGKRYVIGNTAYAWRLGAQIVGKSLGGNQ